MVFSGIWSIFCWSRTEFTFIQYKISDIWSEFRLYGPSNWTWWCPCPWSWPALTRGGSAPSERRTPAAWLWRRGTLACWGRRWADWRKCTVSRIHRERILETRGNPISRGRGRWARGALCCSRGASRGWGSSPDGGGRTQRICRPCRTWRRPRPLGLHILYLV